MHSFREPRPKPVVHLLTVYLAGTMDREGPLYRLSTESSLPLPLVGEEIDPQEWPEPWFQPEFPGRPLTVVKRAIGLQDLDDVVLCECVLTVDWSADADPPELVAANHETDRMRRRAEFYAEVADDLVPAVASKALDGCVAAIVASLSLERPQWGDQEVESALHEAAGMVQAVNNMHLDMLARDLCGRAMSLIRDLPLADRVAVWLYTTSEDTGERGDLWDRDDLLRHFDPLTAYSGALDDAHQRIVSAVLGALQDVRLDFNR